MSFEKIRYFLQAPVVRTAMVILILLVGAVVLFYPYSPKPQESDRVSMRNYSIIKPHDWDAHLESPEHDRVQLDRIRLLPGKYIGNPPGITVARYIAPPDLTKLRDGNYGTTKFQGSEALFNEIVNSKRVTDKLVFQRGDDWFEISMILPGMTRTQKDDFWKYVETFKYAGPIPREARETSTTTRAAE